MTLPITPPVGIDFLFLLATAAFGWGLSLATYRFFALRRGWPMGKLQAETPAVPILIGLFGVIVAFLFAAARGAAYGGWWILVFGLLWAVFWTGLLRVAAQVALFLAPAATFLLIFSWAASGGAFQNYTAHYVPASTQAATQNGAQRQPQPAPQMGLPSAPRPLVVETQRIEPPPRGNPDTRRIEELTRGMTNVPSTPRGPVPQQ